MFIERYGKLLFVDGAFVAPTICFIAGEGEESGDSGGSTDSGTGSEGDSDQGKNNGGQSDDIEGFWNDDADSQGKPTGSEGQSVTDSDKPGEPVDHFGRALDAMVFDSPVNQDAFTENGEINLEKLNEQLLSNNKQVARQTMLMVARLLKASQDQVRDEMGGLIDSRLEDSKSIDFLEKAIPAAADPDVRPVLEGVYAQALKRSKGDRAKALAQTKKFFKKFQSSAGADLELDTPPQPMGGVEPNSESDWMDLLSPTDP